MKRNCEPAASRTGIVTSWSCAVRLSIFLLALALVNYGAFLWLWVKRCNHQSKVIVEFTLTLEGVRSSSMQLNVGVLVTDDEMSAIDYDGLRACVEREDHISVMALPCNPLVERDLQKNDLLIVPGGRASVMAKKLGPEGIRAIRQYVQRGGGYVGICAGGFLASAGYSWSLQIVDAVIKTGINHDPIRGRISIAERGVGNVTVSTTEQGRQLFPKISETLLTRYASGPFFVPGERDDIPDYVVAAEYESEVATYECQVGTMKYTPAIAVSVFGEGRVVLFGFHPEAAPGSLPLLIDSLFMVARRAE